MRKIRRQHYDQTQQQGYEILPDLDHRKFTITGKLRLNRIRQSLFNYRSPGHPTGPFSR
ncbi:MAG: hypothetical protein GY703_04285 [Gammaproteobacteria bacterium]|nr:hypothetical protein [Gammaproteobacteria bacterium]